MEEEVLIIKQLKDNPFSIKNIDNPTEEMKIAAVSSNPSAIQYIKEQSRNLREIAVKKKSNDHRIHEKS